MIKTVVASLTALMFIGVSAATYADDNVSQQIQFLNSQIQAQFQKAQADQIKQNQALNTQLQLQLKQMHTDLQDQIQKMNAQTQDQIKQVQATLQQQIQVVQQQAIKAKQ